MKPVVAPHKSWNSKILTSIWEPFVKAANIWKLQIICCIDFKFRQSKDLGSASNITIQVMWGCFVTSSHLHLSSTARLTLLLILSCSVSFSSFSLNNGSWRESLSDSNEKSTTVTELLSSILKNEILKASIFFKVRLFSRISSNILNLFLSKTDFMCNKCIGNTFCVINVLETTWNDYECSLNIVIDPKVANTNFKITIHLKPLLLSYTPPYPPTHYDLLWWN